MELYWWLFILAIFFCIFADKIDGAVKADKKLKKIIIVISAGVVVVVLMGIIARLLG